MKILRALMLTCIFFGIATQNLIAQTENLPEIEVRAPEEQPQQAEIGSNKTSRIASFDLVIGDQDIYGPVVIGGIFSYAPSTTNSSPQWSLMSLGSWVTIDGNSFFGTQGYSITLPNNTLQSSWTDDRTNVLFRAHTTNRVDIGLSLEREVDWQQGDSISFITSNFCHYITEGGVTIFASGSVSNTVTLTKDLELTIDLRNESLIFWSSLPRRYGKYRLEESADMLNWTMVPGSEDYDKTKDHGNYYFTIVPKQESSSRTYRLVEIQ